ncbi:hypothetical protein BVX97_06315, partial [bacterium E08(2017)]
MNDQIINLTINDVVYRGKGLGRHEGCVVFVPYTLPGETVQARITKKRKNFAEAELVSVESASPMRIEPSCPLAGVCQGCSYQHIDYEEELRLKNKQFEDIMTRQAKVSPSAFQPGVGSPSNLEYRNKIVLHAQKEKDKTLLGYFAEDNKTIVDVPQCPLAMKPINKLLKEKRADALFMRSLNDGDKVTFRYTESDGAQCWAGRSEPGKSKLTESTVIGAFKVHSRSFFQVNRAIADDIIESVQELLKNNR